MAIYNSGYQGAYQPMFQPYAPSYPNLQGTQMSPANVPGTPQNQSSIIWVQGEAGAKSYLVAPNSTVQLWDSESQVIYLKSADASGMPSMKILDYTIRDSAQNAPVAAPGSQVDSYATKADVEALKGQIESLRMRIGKLTKKEADNE